MAPYTQDFSRGPENKETSTYTENPSIRTRPPAYGSPDLSTPDPHKADPVEDARTQDARFVEPRTAEAMMVGDRLRAALAGQALQPARTPGDLARQKLQTKAPRSARSHAEWLQAEANRIAEAQVWATLELARVQEQRP